ncbi:YbhB/YbcL family Raf kinase inhibitor-like protein [Brachybacterium hainanense]|uniref:YbhB/YbcL family Raf kinase inhibitor-like protein n=1 Tax=Brachybacterium hainanense TaxID=1541174 RepID=A0ABV6RAY2_9MICO
MSPDTVSPDTRFRLSSQALPSGSVVGPQQLVPELGGENLSPDLAWELVPEDTASFALTCYDPDAPTGSGFWHWIAWDIPADARSLPLGLPREDAVVKQAANDFGRIGYDGPQPPPGAPHRYIFTLHALPVAELGVDPSAPHVQARFAIFSQQLDAASFTVTYKAS